jgi:hypothetical protein
VKYLRELVRNLEVEPILQELEGAAEHWNEYSLRTAHYGGQHSQVSDLWVRFRPFEDFGNIRDEKGLRIGHDATVVRFVGEPHDSAWYPCIAKLPSIKDVAYELMHHYRGDRLGGILITRIPPGAEVKPHQDGGWHATYYEKLALQLKGAPDQAFCFEDGEFTCPAGTLYTFDNSKKHWVYNRSSEERMTLFICLRRDGRPTLVAEGG